MANWLTDQWHQVRGHFKYDILRSLLGGVVIAAGTALLDKVRRVPIDWLLLGSVFVVASAVLFLTRRRDGSSPQGGLPSTQIVAPSSGLEKGIQSVREYYKSNTGRMLEEVEEHCRKKGKKAIANDNMRYRDLFWDRLMRVSAAIPLSQQSRQASVFERPRVCFYGFFQICIYVQIIEYLYILFHMRQHQLNAKLA